MKIIIFSLFCAFFCFLPAARAAEISYEGGNFYLPVSKTAYQLNKKIILSQKSFYKIEQGVKIDFGPEGDVCFSENNCLKGDWILKTGLKSCSVTFDSLFYVYADTGAEKIIFQVSKKGESDYLQKIKDVPFLVKSLDPSVNYVNLKIANDEYSFRFFIYMMSGLFDKVGGPSIPTSFLPSAIGPIDSPAPIRSNSGEFIASTAAPISHVGEMVADSLDINFSRRQSGLIFLEIQKKGEAWYVNPLNYQRYYLGRPADAFFVMKSLGLGVKHQVIEGGIFSDRLAGRILIDVEDKGKAYYISPKSKKAYYLGRPQDAFRVMRELGVGISDADIKKIEIGKI